MTYQKKVAVMIIGIIFIVVGSFVMASLVHEDNVEVLDMKDPIQVDDTDVTFKLYRVDQKFFLQIPDDFIILDEATLKERYGLRDRPGLIFQTSDDKAHVLVTMTDYQVDDANLASYVDTIKSGLNDFIIQNYEVKENHGKIFVKLTGLDHTNQLYKDIRYFTLDNKLVIVEFNTALTEENTWKKTSTMILDSICFDEADVKKK